MAGGKVVEVFGGDCIIWGKSITLENGYKIDVLIEDALIVELKSVDRILPIHEAQLLTYLKLAGIKTGLLINFNVCRLKDGLKRFVL